MNRFLILLAAITLSCGNSVNKVTSENEVSQELENTEMQKDMLLGEFEKDDLRQAPFSEWFVPAYDDFSPKAESMETIDKNINDYEIKVLMGTWCGDSKRELPKLIKLLDKSGFDYNKLDLIAVDYDKTTPSKVEEELNVQYVPTIIFYKDGKEVNRFVEYAQEESLEEDIAKIISGEAYKNSYAE